MSDILSKLNEQQVIMTVLRAEIAALLHNIGKLDPNFLASHVADKATAREKLEDEGVIIDNYLFKRFATPSCEILDKDRDLICSQKIESSDLEALLNGLSSDEVPSTVSAAETFNTFLKKNGPLYETLTDERKRINGQNDSIEKRVDEWVEAQHDGWREQYGNDGAKALEQRKRAEQKEKFEQEIEDNKHILQDKERRLQFEHEDELTTFTLTVAGETWCLTDLLTLFWDDFFYWPGGDEYARQSALAYWLKADIGTDLLRLLILAHGEVSGHEKRGWTPNRESKETDDKEEKPSFEKLRLATAFGYEVPVLWKEMPAKRFSLLDVVPDTWSAPDSKRREFNRYAKEVLSIGLGDTRRPINEITLWDYASSIAALFKSAVAKSVLEAQLASPATMRWHLLGVRLDGLSFLFQALQVADLAGRQEILRKTLDVIQELLEKTMPLGNEVYRDENGSVFIIPELVSATPEDLRQELYEHIQGVLRREGLSDIVPVLTLSEPRRGKQLNLGEILTETAPVTCPDKKQMQRWWSSSVANICSVCGLRPQGYVNSGKARERKVCGICLARRGRRSQEWARAKGKRSTIWVDEVADTNGRAALIVGNFGLLDWLNGKLVSSMAVGHQKDSPLTILSKIPSFARIQRVWRTTFEFWQEQQQRIDEMLCDDRRRLQIELAPQPDLGDYHAYDLAIGATTMSVVWDAQRKVLLSADNLGRIARALGAEKPIWQSPAAAAIFVEDRLKEIDGLEIYNPDDYLHRRNLIRGASITGIQFIETAYATTIPILAEPRTFMALVPADRALDIVEEIRAKYGREMGKVQGRLPLHLGVVVFDRKQPLHAALDAGRRMLRHGEAEHGRGWETWQVTKIDPPLKTDDGVERSEPVPELAVSFTNGIEWKIPTVMGDGQTVDAWYPYFFVEKLADREADDQPQRSFRAPFPDKAEAEELRECELIHVLDLHAGDRVYVQPGTFDFVHLETTGRRYEIAYAQDANGRLRRRGETAGVRPYYLDEIPRLRELWTLTAGRLSSSQWMGLLETIETRREQWEIERSDKLAALVRALLSVRSEEQWEIERVDKLATDDLEEPNKVFTHFIDDTLRNVEGDWWKNLEAPQRAWIKADAITGVLADVLQLHHTALKLQGLKDENDKIDEEERS